MNKALSQINFKLKNIFHFETLSTDDSSLLIKQELLANKPSMIARFGAVEIKAVIYPNTNWIIKHILKHRVYSTMTINAGFFPTTEVNIKRFSDLMMEDMKLLDILGSWRVEEQFLKKNYAHAKLVSLKSLEPYLLDDPWSEVLEGKKVLVIHPFSETILNQYQINRKNLFKNSKVLPKFKSLEVIKAVQSIAGNKSNYNDWFEALNHMKNQIEEKDFDIAIIGCGAYGFPLAAHVKRIGKKSIHLGGATQILFGIKGKRWIEREDFKSIINEYFVEPGNKDKPQNAESVEGGCYW